MRILAIPGSLGLQSSNVNLLRGAADLAAREGLSVEIWHGLDELPFFGPDRAENQALGALKRLVAAAEVVWIATPEYAGGMPGALKNALDWLVGTGELYGKPMVIMSAAPGPQRGQNARRWVAEVVRMQGAEVRDSFTVVMPSGADAAMLETAIAEAAQRALTSSRRSAVART